MENFLRGLSYLSEEKKLNGHIVSELVIKLLNLLSNAKIEKFQSISLSFYSIGTMSNNGNLEGTIPALLLENLITQLVGFETLPQKSIKNVLYLLGNLARLDN